MSREGSDTQETALGRADAPPPTATALPGGPAGGASGQVFSWAMRSRGVRGMCKPQWGQVQKVRRQSLYRSVSLCRGHAVSGPCPRPQQPV